MTEHEERNLDDQLEDMQERSEQLEDEISDAREDWERKKDDPSVPGAPEDASSEDEGG